MCRRHKNNEINQHLLVFAVSVCSKSLVSHRSCHEWNRLPGDCQRYCRGRARSGRDCQGTVNATVEDGHEEEGTARGLSTLLLRTGTKRKGLPGDCQRYCRGRARSGRDCQGTVNATVEDGHEAEGTARGLSTLLSRTGTKRKGLPGDCQRYCR